MNRLAPPLLAALVLAGPFAAVARAQEAPGPRIELDGAYDPANGIARIIRGEVKVPIVFQDDHILAFMPPGARYPGDVVIVSKVSKARNLLDADPAELERMIRLAQRVARAERVVFKAEGITAYQNNGTPSNQTVAHMHLHVAPRFYGPTPADVPTTDPKALAEAAAKVAAALQP